MNILVDIGHPAHVHLFKNAIEILRKKGHTVFITIKDIPSAVYLLKKYNLEYIFLGKKYDSLVMKGLSQLIYDIKMIRIARKLKIDLAIGSSITITHARKFTKMKTIVFDDDDAEQVKLFAKFAHPLADNVLSPSALSHQRLHARDITYAGTHELFYLHPKYFFKNPDFFEKYNIDTNIPFFVVRFVAVKAYHDVGEAGLTLNQKKQIIELLSKRGNVFITSERKIEEEFEQYRLPVPPEEIHSLLSYASMFLGDSQTMTSEAAILGTPALKCNTFAGKLSVPNELEEKYGLCYSFQPSDFDQFMSKAKELLGTPNLKELWAEKRKKFLNDKIDVTAFMVWFIENYPESAKIMKENPDYQYRFK